MVIFFVFVMQKLQYLKKCKKPDILHIIIRINLNAIHRLSVGGIDYLYYNVGYDQGALWSYRIQHYSEQFKTGNLHEADLKILREILADNFQEWLRFVEDILNNDESTEMIRGNDLDYDPEKVKGLVSAEYGLFQKEPEAYIKEIMNTGMEHRLFQIPAYIQHNKIRNRETTKKIRNEMRPLFKRIQSMDTRLNLKNCKELFQGPSRKLKMLFSYPGKKAWKELIRSGYLTVNALKDLDLFQRINEDCDWFKNAPSGRTHINHYIRWAKEHRGDGKHFACIHIDDIHNPEVFFTYDTDNMDLIQKEKKDAEDLLEQIPMTYSGSLTHDLSLRYMDNVLRYLYEEMEREGLLEDTCIAICADHGFSFSGNPLRDSFIINLYLENYNIPCVLIGSEQEPREIKELRTSKDIPATLCALACGKVPDAFSGHSLTEKFDYPVVQIEYCGGGCPDLTRREIKLAAFDNSFFVGTLCTLDEPLTDEKITEVYNLEVDPGQKRNLYKKYDQEKARKYIQHIEKRRTEIRNTMKWTNG